LAGVASEQARLDDARGTGLGSGGGTAVVGAINDLPGGMNAFAASDYSAVQHHQFVNLMTLIRYDEAFQPAPYLAESWTVEEDGSAVVFQLRDDVYWHDGEPTDAEDVAFTYLRMTDPATAYPNAAYWDFYVPGPEGVEVLDERTVRIRMQPHAEFLDPWRTVAIMPEHLLGDVPREELREHPFGTQCPVGNGPFVFVGQSPLEGWTFRRNDRFSESLGGPPLLERLIYRVVPDETTLLVELLNGEVDVYVAPNPSQAARIMEQEETELLRFPSRNYGFVAWNTRRPVLADPSVRRALTTATDREAIVQGLLEGYGSIADNGVPPFHWAFGVGPDGGPSDPERARDLLQAAGWTDRDGDGIREDADGRRLSISLKYNQGNQLRKDIAEVMQAQLGEIGVEVVPEEVEWGTLLGQLFEPEARDFDGVVLSWVVDFKLDESGLFHSEADTQPTGLAGLQSAELDALLDGLKRASDRVDAVNLWDEYLTVLDREHPYTYLFFPDRLAGVNRRLRGVTMDARGEWAEVRSWSISGEGTGGG
jgi:peptide/nickel transport system substrate-binding protein